MRLRRFVPVFLVLAAFPAAVQALHCVESLPTTPLSRLKDFVDMGGGQYFRVGDLEERDLRPTIVAFRKLHPNLAVRVTYRSFRSDVCYDYLRDVTFVTTALKTAPAKMKPATLRIAVRPWAHVFWANAYLHEVTTSRPLVLEDLSCGTYTFRFESDIFDPLTRSVEVCGKDVFLEVDLYREAPTKTKLQ